LSGVPHKHILLKLFNRDRSAVIEISDSGVGIPQEHKDKIFDPFYTTKSPGNGAGLGLYLSQGIIKKHFGEIKLESHPGQGTTVTLFLPLAD
ncbi:MAG: two-component system NtrC family sensor kinase, partial [Cyclobacteriaceae bacterium]